MGHCRLCNGPCEQKDYLGSQGPESLVDCPRCGEYVITQGALDCIGDDKSVTDNIHLLSAVARHSWDRGERLRIDANLVRDRSEFEAKVLSQCPRSVAEKADCILRYIAGNSLFPGNEVVFPGGRDYPRFYCRNFEELGFHLDGLEERELVTCMSTDRDTLHVTLTGNGWQHVEELEEPNIESKQAFVAMWFDDQMDSAFKDGIQTLEEETGYQMLRIDMKEFNDKICDHIIAEIRRSRFLIADVTGHRHAVYFEAGYAKGLGLEVIWTCREDAMEETGRKFDTRQYKHITWKTPDELREKLRDRILATMGKAT